MCWLDDETQKTARRGPEKSKLKRVCCGEWGSLAEDLLETGWMGKEDLVKATVDRYVHRVKGQFKENWFGFFLVNILAFVFLTCNDDLLSRLCRTMESLVAKKLKFSPSLEPESPHLSSSASLSGLQIYVMAEASHSDNDGKSSYQTVGKGTSSERLKATEHSKINWE